MQSPWILSNLLLTEDEDGDFAFSFYLTKLHCGFRNSCFIDLIFLVT